MLFHRGQKLKPTNLATANTKKTPKLPESATGKAGLKADAKSPHVDFPKESHGYGNIVCYS